jgi:hypothetical protein
MPFAARVAGMDRVPSLAATGPLVENAREGLLGVGDALQLHASAIVEGKSRIDHQVLDRPRDEDLPRARQRQSAYAYLRKTATAFWPPNPKPLTSAARTGVRRAVFGT